MCSIWISWMVYLSTILSMRGEKGLAILSLLLLPTQRSSVHTQLWRIWKPGSGAAGKKRTLNQFHSPVNYNPAFLISSPRTILFMGVQAKHGPCRPHSSVEQTVLFCALATCQKHDWRHTFLDMERKSMPGFENKQNKGKRAAMSIGIFWILSFVWG